MIAITVASIAFSFIFLGILAGWVIKRFLPGNQVPDNSKEIVKTAAGLMATLVALVIGLLVSSAKSSFDTTNTGITQMGAKTIMLDRIFVRYGPETKPMRLALAKSIEVAMEKIWPSEAGKPADMEGVEKGTAAEELYEKVIELEPKTEAQKHLRTQAIQILGDILQSRWHIIEQNQNILPPMFIMMLILWLTILFLFFSLLSPHNAISLFALFFSALSVSTALFLILEMNRPFQGTIRVSKAPLEKALTIMRR